MDFFEVVVDIFEVVVDGGNFFQVVVGGCRWL